MVCLFIKIFWKIRFSKVSGYSLVIKFYKVQYVMGIRNLASVCSSGATVCFVWGRGGGGAADARTRTPRPAGARCPSTSCSPPAAAPCIIQVCTYVCMYVWSTDAECDVTRSCRPRDTASDSDREACLPHTTMYVQCSVESEVQLTRSYRYHPNKRIIVRLVQGVRKSLRTRNYLLPHKNLGLLVHV